MDQILKIASFLPLMNSSPKLLKIPKILTVGKTTTEVLSKFQALTKLKALLLGDTQRFSGARNPPRTTQEDVTRRTDFRQEKTRGVKV